MAEFLDIEVQTRQFFTALDTYVKALPVERDKAMRRQFRILIQRIMAWTPPTNGKRASNMADAEKAGQAAILRDIMYWIVLYKESTLEWLSEENPSGYINHFEHRTKDGRVWLIDRTRIDPTGSLLPAEHAKRRDIRGRVPMASSRSQTKDIGRHKARDLVATTFEASQKYIKRQQAHSGLAKSGWLPAFSSLGGMSPAWIARHGTGNGFYNGKSSPGEFLMHANNHAKSIGSLAPRLVRSSIAAQARAMVKELLNASKSAKKLAKLQSDISAS